MLYYVSSSRLGGSLEPDCSTPIPQLRRIWATNGNLSNHVLVSIVKLMVETNLVTSKHLRQLIVEASTELRCHDALPSSHARSASVSIVSLLMIALFPVSGSFVMCIL